MTVYSSMPHRIILDSKCFSVSALFVGTFLLLVSGILRLLWIALSHMSYPFHRHEVRCGSGLSSQATPFLSLLPLASLRCMISAFSNSGCVEGRLYSRFWTIDSLVRKDSYPHMVVNDFLPNSIFHRPQQLYLLSTRSLQVTCVSEALTDFTRNCFLAQPCQSRRPWRCCCITQTATFWIQSIRLFKRRACWGGHATRDHKFAHEVEDAGCRVTLERLIETGISVAEYYFLDLDYEELVLWVFLAAPSSFEPDISF